MDSVQTVTRLKGSLCYRLVLLFIWAFIFHDDVVVVVLVAAKMPTVVSQLASPPSVGLFEPIEISPSVLPHYPFPEVGGNLLPPMYPAFPPTYNPVLTGRCPVNFSSISTILDRTAADCSQPLAAFVGNVICCPQFASLLRLFQGYYSSVSDIKLVLQDAVADDCFTDIVSILASRGANSSIATLCSAKSSNLTGGSCPVKDINTYEKVVNSSKLLEACSAVDPLKECCRPICQPAIMAAALQISSSQSIDENMNMVRQPTHIDALNDCKGVVYSWMSRKLPLDTANSAFRILSACKVNKVCPLEFKQPSEVLKACRNVAAPSPFCCSSLSTYIAGIQKQMLITNRQAIICATMFGSMLKKGGVLTDLYELCDIDLKDFSLQAYGQQGCLLRSLPADVVDDNSSGMSFTCDLNDNIAAPWPSSSSMSSLSLCAPEMSLPALPTSETLGSPGSRGVYLDLVVTIFWFIVVFGLLLY